MLSWTVFAVLAQTPGVAVSNSPAPPVVIVPAPPYPGYVAGEPIDAVGPPPAIVAVPYNPPPPVHPIQQGAMPPVQPPPAIVRQPQARAALHQLIALDDYPPSALARREEGRVAFTLDVGADGRVHGCTIGHSSGSAALDSATCMIMRRRRALHAGCGQPWHAGRGESQQLIRMEAA